LQSVAAWGGSEFLLERSEAVEKSVSATPRNRRRFRWNRPTSLG
jgi:hypothetical protein